MKNSIKLYKDEDSQLESERLFSKEEIENFLNSDLNFNKFSIEKNKKLTPDNKFWNILIVDDEKDIHRIIKLSLNSFSLNNKKISFFHAYSAKEAKQILNENNIALIFLDVVMETTNAGLDLIKYIREEKKNKLVQIILNTGQAGIAPEREVITKYHINFYQTKSEFTENKLFTITAASLRAYDSLKEIKEYSENLEVKVYQRTKDLELALNTKDKLFSIIAHDLRNPFNAILGFSKLLKENYIKEFNEAQIIKYAKAINSSSNQVYELLTNLLDWARAQSKNIKVNFDKIDINNEIKEAIKLYNSNSKEKSNKIYFNTKKELFVKADKNLTNAIIRNLLSNALKYTENGKITIHTKAENDKCKISIEDTGIGIEKSKINNLLSLSQNTPTKGTRKEKGTGLGLIICKEFIALNKGDFFIESQINKGSKFSFTLPLYY